MLIRIPKRYYEDNLGCESLPKALARNQKGIVIDSCDPFVPSLLLAAKQYVANGQNADLSRAAQALIRRLRND